LTFKSLEGIALGHAYRRVGRPRRHRCLRRSLVRGGGCLVIDGKVVISGRVPSADDIAALLAE